MRNVIPSIQFLAFALADELPLLIGRAAAIATGFATTVLLIAWS